MLLLSVIANFPGHWHLQFFSTSPLQKAGKGRLSFLADFLRVHILKTNLCYARLFPAHSNIKTELRCRPIEVCFSLVVFLVAETGLSFDPLKFFVVAFCLNTFLFHVCGYSSTCMPVALRGWLLHPLRLELQMALHRCELILDQLLRTDPRSSGK